MSLEQEIRRALKRKDPPAGFDDRVLSKIAAGDIVHVRVGTRRWSRAVLPIAASLMIAIGGTYYVQQQQQRRAEEAYVHAEQRAHDVVLALQIASDQISAAQAKVEEMTRHEPKNDF
jgi:uncharacterized protein HemX